MPRRVKKCSKLCLTFGVVDVEKGVVRKLRKRATGESVFIWLLKEIFYIFCAYVSSPRFLSLPRPFCYLPHLYFASLFVVSAPPLPLPLLWMPKQKERGVLVSLRLWYELWFYLGLGRFGFCVGWACIGFNDQGQFGNFVRVSYFSMRDWHWNEPEGRKSSIEIWKWAWKEVVFPSCAR